MCAVYRALIESVLTFSITVWGQKKELNRLVKAASRIIGEDFPFISDISNNRI